MTGSLEASLLIFCLLAIAVSVLITIRYFQLMRIFRWVPPASVYRSERPKVAVIVPARNEELDLSACLTAVLDQEGVDVRVIVVNDHSTDDTGKIADGFAQRDARVQVVHNPDLRPGWLGKANAMQSGVELASEELVVFTDADILHAKNCFVSLLAVMDAKQLAFVSLMPRIRCVSLIENVNAPAYVGGFCQIAGEMARPGSDRAFGAGACMLMKRSVLSAIGGLAKIKDQMLDDVELATLVRRSGYGVGFWAASNLVPVRLFKGNQHALFGMAKNVLAEMPRRAWMTPIAILVPFLVFWSPLLTFVLGCLWREWWLAAVGGLTYVAQYLLLLPSATELCEVNRAKMLFFPLVSFVLLCACSLALYHYYIRGAVYWRGRSIQVHS